MSHDDFDFEVSPGLPTKLPEGEHILWQGSPHWPTLASRVLHVHWIAAYMAVLLGWRLVSGLERGMSLGEIGYAALPLVALFTVALAILGVIARAMGRTTIYTITTRRVVMRIGVALPVTFNLPFASITAADVARLGRGRGEIALRLTGGTRLAYLVLWPHARPWRLKLPEPMFRAIADVDRVATLLGEALAADAGRVEAPTVGTVVVSLPDIARAPSAPVTSEGRLVAAE